MGVKEGGAEPSFAFPCQVVGVTQRATRKKSEALFITHAPTAFGLCISIIQSFVPGRMSNGKFSLFWDKYIFTNQYPYH